MVPPVLQARRTLISRSCIGLSCIGVIGSGDVVVASPESRTLSVVSRPTRFEHFKYLGDKRKQVVYDLDLTDSDPDVAVAVDELMASQQFASFGPDTLAEARNRGYHAHRSIRSSQPA
jgi:hypothetical protein